MQRTMHHKAGIALLLGALISIFRVLPIVLSDGVTGDNFPPESLDDVIARLRSQQVEIGAITRSAEGSLIVTADDIVEIPAEPVDHVVDTTGAGDLYAAGFLTGLARGLDLDVCGRLGSIAAAEVISHMGPRPQASLTELVGDLL